MLMIGMCSCGDVDTKLYGQYKNICIFLLELLLQNSGRLLLLCNLLAESFRLGGDPGHHDLGAHHMEMWNLWTRAANLEDILDSEDGGASWPFRLFGRTMSSFQPFHDRSKIAIRTARNRHGVSSVVALYTAMLYSIQTCALTHTKQANVKHLKEITLHTWQNQRAPSTRKNETHSKAQKNHEWYKTQSILDREYTIIIHHPHPSTHLSGPQVQDLVTPRAWEQFLVHSTVPRSSGPAEMAVLNGLQRLFI